MLIYEIVAQVVEKLMEIVAQVDEKGLSNFLVVEKIMDHNVDVHEDQTQQENTPAISARHYKALDKEQRKVKPNKSVINMYLNLEFTARRNFLEQTNKESRPDHIFEAYPCFKDPNEVSIIIASGTNFFPI